MQTFKEVCWDFMKRKYLERLFHFRASSQFVGWLLNRCFKAFILLNRMCKLTSPRSFSWMLHVKSSSLTNFLRHLLDAESILRAPVRLRLYTMLIISVVSVSDDISCIKHHQMFHSHQCFHQMNLLTILKSQIALGTKEDCIKILGLK